MTSDPTPTAPREPSPLIRARLPLLWATLLLAGGAALLAGAVAYGLIEGLGLSPAWAASLAAALGLFAAAVPMVALMVKASAVVRSPGSGVDGLDVVTGGLGKTMFNELAERECARARRYGTGAALLLIDVDRYAALCQTHGAEAGEAVLRELARQTVPTLRGADALARFGPSQLAVFLAQADATGALDVAERIRERAERLEVPFHPQRLRVAVSVGVAQLRPAHLNLRALNDDSDQAVLAARQAGGNCVRSAPVDVDLLKSPGSPIGDHRYRP